MKLVYFAKRRSNTPIDAFRQLFQTVELAAASEERLDQYIQNHTRPNVYLTREPCYDVIVELSSADERVAQRVCHEGALVPSVAALIDHDLSVAFLVGDELLVKDSPVPIGAIKSFALTHRPPDHARAPFFDHWATVHGPIAARIPTMLRYVQYHSFVPVAAPDGRVLEGCAVTWFESTAAMRAATATSEFAATMADEPNFIDGESPHVLADELVMSSATWSASQ